MLGQQSPSSFPSALDQEENTSDCRLALALAQETKILHNLRRSYTNCSCCRDNRLCLLATRHIGLVEPGTVNRSHCKGKNLGRLALTHIGPGKNSFEVTRVSVR